MSNILKENKKSMKEYKNERQSNFELLRIIAMIMIVAHHLTIHCFAVQLGDKSLYALGESFNKAIFLRDYYFLNYL